MLYLLLFIFTEQKRLNDRYATEICNVLDKDISAIWGCDLDLPLHTLTVPVLPCHFIAIEPQLYSGIVAANHAKAVKFNEIVPRDINVWCN